MDLLRQIPLIMGVLFIAIGVFHGWKLRSVVRRCTVYADGKKCIEHRKVSGIS